LLGDGIGLTTQQKKMIFTKYKNEESQDPHRAVKPLMIEDEEKQVSTMSLIHDQIKQELSG
jgi:hypothetical protein